MPVPTQIRLFCQGENPSEKGLFHFDANDARAVMQRYRQRGTRLSFDYDHAILEPSRDPKPDAGHGGLEARGDGLYAVDIRWTAEARELIETEKYRYFSPFFEHDEAGHVQNLINVGLTNTPALWGIPRLMAASSGRRVAFMTPLPFVSAALTASDRHVARKLGLSDEQMARSYQRRAAR